MNRECTIVTEVKCERVAGPSPYIVETQINRRGWVTANELQAHMIPYPYENVKTERINPIEFCDPMTGERKWIGMTSAVYDKLRMPYQAIESLEEKVAFLRKEEYTAKGRIKDARRYLATRWKAVDGARKKLNYYQGRFCTYHQLNDRVRKFEKMSVWEFIKYRLSGWTK